MAKEYEQYLLSPEWEARRARELGRAGECCEFCGAGECEVLHVHHLSYEHLGQELDGDLIVLCQSCHADAHAFPNVDAAIRQLAESRADQERKAEIDRENGLRAARAILERLENRSALGDPELGAGYCMECGKDAYWRWILTNKKCSLALCYFCRRRRKAIAVELGIDPPLADDLDWAAA